MTLKHASTIPIVTCSACGFSNLPGEMFCQNCGVQLPPVASVPPPPPTPVVEASGQSQLTPNLESRQVPSNRPSAGIPAGSGRAADQGQYSGRLIIREKGIVIPLPPDQPELVIGRTDPVQDIYPDVDLAEQEGEQSGVSRRHARVLQRLDGIYIEDLNSTNFTFLNRTRLQPGQIYLLKDGDEIRLGVLTLEYRI